MPQLTTLIDKFLRRVGLSDGEKTTLLGDLGAAKASPVIFNTSGAGISIVDTDYEWGHVIHTHSAPWSLSVTAGTGITVGSIILITNACDHQMALDSDGGEVTFSGAVSGTGTYNFPARTTIALRYLGSDSFLVI